MRCCRKMRRWPLLAICMVGLTAGVMARADAPASNAPTVTTAKNSPAPATEQTQTTRLGKINVTAMKELVKTLQVVKVALHESFSDSASQANVVVCRIVEGHGYLNVQERMGAVLECGTNSWFTWQRDKCRIGGMAACTPNGPGAAAYKRKGAWHSMRALNLQQLMALRQLLKELPPPGRSDVVVVDKSGKTVTTVKADGNSPPDKN